MKRQIINGKLDIVSQLVGGPADGMLVMNSAEMIRIPKQREITPLFSYSARLDTMPTFEVSNYRRVSVEKLAFDGVSEI